MKNIILALCMVCLLTGCNKKETRFVQIDQIYDEFANEYNVMVDLETGVKYLAGGHSFSPFYDSKGNVQVLTEQELEELRGKR